MARIDPRTNRVVKRIAIGFQSYGVAFGAGSVWVTSEADGTVRRISPKTNRVTKAIKVGSLPNGVVYAFGALWVAESRQRRPRPRRREDEPRHEADQAREGRLDHAVAGRALGLERDGPGRPRRPDAAAQIVARVRVGANPLGSAWISESAASSGCRTSTTARCRSSTRRRNAVRTTLTAGKEPLGDRRGRRRRLAVELGRRAPSGGCPRNSSRPQKISGHHGSASVRKSASARAMPPLATSSTRPPRASSAKLKPLR